MDDSRVPEMCRRLKTQRDELHGHEVPGIVLHIDIPDIRGRGRTVERQGSPRVPVNLEERHTRFSRQHVPQDTVQLRLRRRVAPHLLVVIVVVHIVARTEKLLTPVRARDEDDGDAQQVLLRNSLRIGSCHIKVKLVHSQRNRTHKHVLELLVVPLILCRPHIYYPPFQVIGQRLVALKGYVDGDIFREATYRLDHLHARHKNIAHPYPNAPLPQMYSPLTNCTKKTSHA
mmetsp:Transcript_26332/g.73587  ORF Transcript_26332/g.73587 Transcript_26332/m.73587 type:complete len:230 (+) Transcript_26332:264-953(+)